MRTCKEVRRSRPLENAFRESEALLRTVLESSRDAMVAIDEEGRIQLFNRAAEKLFQRDRSEVLGGPLDPLIPPRLREKHRGYVESYFRYGTPSAAFQNTIEITALRGNGEEVPVEASLSPGAFEGERFVLAVLRDMTERKRLEQALIQGTKMEALGQLAGGVAHDFNNLLTAIQGHVGILRMDAEPGSPVYASAEVIEKAVEKGAALVQQLLGFARRGRYEALPLDLHDLLRDAALLLDRTLTKSIRTVLELEARHRRVEGDPVQLQQVILNLALNARDAMPEGGTLTLRTEEADLTESFCRMNPGSRGGRYLRVSVKDTGTGIPSEIRQKIFEPFFTTKPRGAGTGMGLATAYGIVKNHGGYIQVESEPGRGTAFHIYLPLTERAVEKTAADDTEEDRPQPGRETLLLVDDDPEVRRAAALMLERAGFRVRVAASGAEAVEIYRRDGRKIDGVVLDMVMPGMNGRACFQALKEMDPGVRVLLTTGYTEETSVQETLEEGMAGFIRKPFRVKEIAAKVREMLGEAPVPHLSGSSGP